MRLLEENMWGARGHFLTPFGEGRTMASEMEAAT